MLWRNKQPIKPGTQGWTPSLDSLRRKLHLWNCQLKIYSTSAGNVLWDAFYHHYLASLMQMCARFCFESYKKYPNHSVCLLPFVLHCLSKTTNCCLLNFTRNFWQERMVPERRKFPVIFFFFKRHTSMQARPFSLCKLGTFIGKSLSLRESLYVASRPRQGQQRSWRSLPLCVMSGLAMYGCESNMSCLGRF